VSSIKKTSQASSIAISVFVGAILAVLFVPIPTALLDALIIFNFGLTITILFTTLFVEKPVSFSTFPSLLLMVTLLRLALNIAATRLILTQAQAGAVISAIGAFAEQGNFVIGLVIFFILIIVQYVVVTSGAQRVSEVAARFTLDSLPGQQLSIDADLNLGLITQDEARARRKELEREAAFYGAMDGASKFVKGDAVAGVIILMINIIAGWIIGVVQLNMDWLEALQTFSVLTIGDGIASQVPALIVSTATGIIVTRSAADKTLGREVIDQLSNSPRIMLMALGILAMLLLLPGMPKWLLVIVGLLAAYLFFLHRNHSTPAAGTESAQEGSSKTTAVQEPATIEIVFGRSLSEAWRSADQLFEDRVASLRDQFERERGFRFPPVRFIDGPGLNSNAYEVRLFGSTSAAGELFPGQLLAIKTRQASARVFGPEVRDPSFGLPASWIDSTVRTQAEAEGRAVIDPLTVLFTHVSEVLKAEAPLLLTRAATSGVLEGVRIRQPGLIEELIPNVLTLSEVQKVLQNLLAEGVSIAPIDLIAEALIESAKGSKDPSDLTELVRQKIGFIICQGLKSQNNVLHVINLAPKAERAVLDGVKVVNGKLIFAMDPTIAAAILKGLIAAVDAMQSQGLPPVLLCSSEARRHLRALSRRSAPKLSVISIQETPNNIHLSSFEVIECT